jgi:hypothetical protein
MNVGASVWECMKRTCELCFLFNRHVGFDVHQLFEARVQGIAGPVEGSRGSGKAGAHDDGWREELLEHGKLSGDYVCSSI